MNRRDLVKSTAALGILGLPGWASGKSMPAVYADGEYFPVLQANKDRLLILLSKPLRGHTAFKADRPWSDKLDEVNLTPLGKVL